MLAYLALSDTGREGRERLAGLLWPDTSEEKARASLRHVLQEIREALASHDCHALTAGRRDVELVSGSISVDLTQTMLDVAAGNVPGVLLMRSRAADTILLGYDGISPLFQEWVVAFRTHVHERLVRGLEQGYANKASPRR